MNNKELRRFHGIYLIKNMVNGKCYIGKTEVSFYRRWIFHRWQLKNGIHENSYLQKSYNKYGKENFEFIILRVCTKADNIDELEKKYIVEYKTFENGYNLTIGGEGCTGNKLSEKAKRTIGEKNRINMTGKKMSVQTKQIMSDSAKGHIKSKEHRAKLSKSLMGIVRSDAQKQKCREANQGSKQPTAILNEDIVSEIKLLLVKSKISMKEIGEKYGIAEGTVNGIRLNLRWKHVIVDGWREYTTKIRDKLSKRLKSEDIIIIKTLLVEGKLCQRVIAKMFNTTDTTIYDIKKNKVWKKVIVEGWDNYVLTTNLKRMER